MSGKPGTAAPVTAPSSRGPAAGSTQQTSEKTSRQTATTEQQPAAKPARANPSSTESFRKPSGSTDSDDPFAVDAAETDAAAKAIKAAPRRMKGRTYEVVCPMCETVGFVPRRAAGKDVRCANSECLVPVFTAPEIPEEVPVEEATSSLTPMRIFAALSTVIVLGMLVGAYIVFSGNDSPPKNGAGSPKGPVKIGGDSNGQAGQSGGPSINGNGKTPPLETKKGTPPVVPSLSRAEMLEQLPAMMIKISRITRRNRSKAYCRRLTAEVFALAGDVDGVNKQLDRLRFVAPELTFYRIPPLVLIAWNQLKTGQRTAAGQTADKALDAAGSLPDFGRTPLDFSTQLAALLVVLERTDAAAALLHKHHGDDASAQLSARLQAVAALGSYDFDADGPAAPLIAWKDPQAVAVTLELVGHGFDEAARNWAVGQTDPTVRGDCTAAWAEASADVALHGGQRDRLQQIAAAVNRMKPAVQSRCLARIAGVQLAAGDRKQAQQMLAAAHSALATVSQPSPMVLPGIKQLYALKLPDPTALRLAALAAAELARVEARLEQKPAAWTSMMRCMSYLRATAPGLTAVRDRIADIRRRGPATMRAELKAALDLGSDDKARRALTRYRNRLDALRSAAELRLAIQANLLSRAAEWGLLDLVWKEIQTRTTETNLDKQDPFLETKVPWVVAYQYLDAGTREKAQAIGDALTAAKQKPNLPEQIAHLASARLKSGDPTSAAAQLSNRQVDAAWRMQRMLAIACRLVKQDQWTSAIRFVSGYRDPVAREEAYELIGVLATRIGQRQAVWKTLQDDELAPTERIALARGLADR